MPVIVTVCGVFQLEGVKVRLEADRVPSVMSELESPTVTFAVGALSSTTLNCVVPPASVVVRPLVGVTVMPAGVVAALIDTAPISHCALADTVLLMVTVAAPASDVVLPVLVPLLVPQTSD